MCNSNIDKRSIYEYNYNYIKYHNQLTKLNKYYNSLLFLTDGCIKCMNDLTPEMINNRDTKCKCNRMYCFTHKIPYKYLDVCTCVDRIQFIDNYVCSKCLYIHNLNIMRHHTMKYFEVHKEMYKKFKLKNSVFYYKEFTQNICKDVMINIVDQYIKKPKIIKKKIKNI